MHRPSEESAPAILMAALALLLISSCFVILAFCL